MIEILALCLSFIAVLGFFYLGLRVIRIAEMWVHNGRTQEIHTSTRLFSPAPGQPNQERENTQGHKFKVPDLPPETVAPNLKNPPKSTGFGRQSNGNAQSEPTGD